VLAGGFGVATAQAATPACGVAYKITSQWSTGFGAEVTITNLGDAVNGWTLGWTLGSGQGITQAWNATVTVAGSAVTATNASYNGSVGAGASVSFGFNGSHTGSNPVPATFVFNGTTCTGAAATTSPQSPSPTPCTGPSTPPVTTSPTPSASPTTAPQPVKIWMAGDSTMMNASTCPIGWGSQFAPYFNTDVTVQNSAVGGRSIQTWLYEGNVTGTLGSNGECTLSSTAYNARWTNMLDATTGMKAGDYLFIQFGINDGDTTCPRHVGTARYQQLMTYMAQTALDRGAHPILLTAVAAITCSGSSAVKNRGFVTQTTASGTATGAPVIDLQTLSVNYYNSKGVCPNNGDYTSGVVGAFFCNDHTHFEAYGALQIATLVAGALRTQNIPLASYLK
jgi:lysophospholipase L1-like esterase